jgi:hypothetical protein
MSRSQAHLGNRRIARRTLLGATIGVAAGAGLSRSSAWAQDDAISGDITYWHHFTSDSEMVGLEQITALFAEQYPDVTLTSENIPNADFMTQFTTAAVGGSLPNTTMAASDRIPDMLALGGLIDLTERFNAWEGSGSIEPGLMDAATIEGQIYGIPAFLFVDWLYYRKDWFDEAGLAPPTTWDEVREAAITLTDAANDRYGFGLRGGDGGQGHVVAIMRAYGGLSVDENGVPVIDRDKAIEAVAFWSGLFTTDKAAPPSAPNDSYSQIMQAFRTSHWITGRDFRRPCPGGGIHDHPGSGRPGDAGRGRGGALQRDVQGGQWRCLLGLANRMDRERCSGPVPGDHRLLPGLVDRRRRSAHHRQPNLRRGPELDSDRCAAAELRRRPGLAVNLRAPEFPAGADG